MTFSSPQFPPGRLLCSCSPILRPPCPRPSPQGTPAALPYHMRPRRVHIAPGTTGKAHETAAVHLHAVAHWCFCAPHRQEPDIPPLFQTMSKAESPLSFFGDEALSGAYKRYSRPHLRMQGFLPFQVYFALVTLGSPIVLGCVLQAITVREDLKTLFGRELFSKGLEDSLRAVVPLAEVGLNLLSAFQTGLNCSNSRSQPCYLSPRGRLHDL